MTTKLTTQLKCNQDISTGMILKIMRMSTEDGPGIRTTVFFKGCPLKCVWCHNPESITSKPQIQWIESKCIGCRICLDTCPNSALSHSSKGIAIDREICRRCGECASACPSTALELLGESWTVTDLLNEVEKDRIYFEKSEGGITVSGGEPALQTEFAAAFLENCQQRGLHTALDTCGHCRNESFRRLLPHADMVLFDLKEIDPERHRTFTGSSNKTILENLICLKEFIKRNDNPKQLWIRTPIIPGATDRDDNIMGIGKLITQNLKDMVNRWELCAFNNLCQNKYNLLGLTWSFQDCELIREDAMEHFAEVAKKSGVDPQIVHWSGSTRIEGKVHG